MPPLPAPPFSPARWAGWCAIAARLALWLGLGWGPGGAAAAPLMVDGRQEVLPVWPAVQLALDAGGARSVDEMWRSAQAFGPPPSPHATLGVRPEAVWLRIPLSVGPQGGGAWVFDIDHPPLRSVDLYLLRGGTVVLHREMGNRLAVDERPLRTRAHAAVVPLEPGHDQALLVRVQTTGALILPATLNRPAAFSEREQAEQMLQGLLAGLGLCLVIYSLAQWAATRETLFLKYALMTSGSLLFSVYFFGVGAQYLWPGNDWLETRAGGLSALMATTGSFLFIAEALSGPDTSRRFVRAMHAGAWFTAGVAAVYVLGLVETRVISAVVSVLGLVPALMGMRGAIRRTRQGDPIGFTFLLAWTVYFVATAIVIGVINGRLPVNFWTLHSFQFGATLDMLLFMRVLGLRLKAVHSAALNMARERDTLRSLAYTDPLTGLSNRRGIDAALGATLPHCRDDQLLGIYLIDLDGFKPINDQHGHEMGDQLLIAVARRLRECLRASDVVGRLGGDEFIVLASGLRNELQAQTIGEHLLEAFQAPLDVPGLHCQVGLTIGYALAPLDGHDPSNLLRAADAAMYAGKQAGKGRLVRARPVGPARLDPANA